MAGIPNILGSLEVVHSVQKAWANADITVTGAIYRIKNSTTKKKDYGNGSGSGYFDWGFGINASRSSSVYGSSTTVTPLSLAVQYLIKY